MFETLKTAFKIKEIRRKIFITLGLILVYRLGCWIPIPGIDVAAMSASIQGNDFMGLMSAITGGSLQYGTFFAMGIGPYINASIIMQLLTVGIPALERLQKQGEDGRKKIAQYTRYATIILGIIQAVGILVGLGSSVSGGLLDSSLFPAHLGWLQYIALIIIFCAGTAFTMWIGERITEHGVGNGISLLIFVGILSSAGNALISTVSQALGLADSQNQQMQIWSLIFFLATVIIIFSLIVFVDLAERKIPVQYAKQVKGRKMYGGQSTHIPMKVNASGVLPLIFAFALLSFPQLIANMIAPNGGFAIWWATYLGTGTWLYALIVAVLIVFFAFFYAQIQFNPEDVSRNIQQYGGFIPGIRPGKPTTEYLAKINNRITLFGAIFLALVALVPSLIFSAVSQGNAGLINAFSTTGLLIVVSVALEFDKQLEAQIMTRHYKGFMG